MSCKAPPSWGDVVRRRCDDDGVCVQTGGKYGGELEDLDDKAVYEISGFRMK